MTGTTGDTNEEATLEEASFVEYGIEDKPPIGESVLLGFQHYLTMIGANIAVPLALAGAMGMPEAQTARFVGTFFVVSGLATLAQTTFGNRYPIVQGATFSMLAPALAIIGVIGAGWQTTLLELQGAVIAAAAVEVVVGYLGLMGRLKKYLSPVVIAPTIALIGLSLFGVPQITDVNLATPAPEQNWWLVGLTLGLIILFSQYLDNHRAFRLFPVLIGVVSAWTIAAVLSVTGFYAPGTPGYVPLGQVASAKPIQPVMPLQWGMPKFTLPYIIGMFAGVVASMIESFGDYHAVARLSGVGAPSRKRIDHGIGMEGIASVFAGIMGTGNGSTSYSENIGAIGLTGVASRYVVQIGAGLMLVVGFVGYFGQLVATIPTPIVGGLFIAMFGQIAAVGLSNLKYIDLDSQRNLFIVGFALFAGLSIPAYIGGVDAGAFQQGMANVAVLGPVLGTDLVSHTLYVVLGTGMAVGGLVAFVLDNTVAGTRKERGLEAWDAITEDEGDFKSAVERFGSGSGSDPTKAD
ncbi:uracil-xanthine permease family protein [Haladaptatus caseinilyticus]|uniref:uracil-xanthine permease family protein n=1 Tax=Haladaptatus caseinilyticus TaxID=2993314 RepID=UPI00224AB1D2|nr:solute carrier family 23 protein [Haladaptatus caseinilyticus]